VRRIIENATMTTTIKRIIPNPMYIADSFSVEVARGSDEAPLGGAKRSPVPRI
jgi:hypothetical protein